MLRSTSSRLPFPMPALRGRLPPNPEALFLPHASHRPSLGPAAPHPKCRSSEARSSSQSPSSRPSSASGPRQRFQPFLRFRAPRPPTRREGSRLGSRELALKPKKEEEEAAAASGAAPGAAILRHEKAREGMRENRKSGGKSAALLNEEGGRRLPVVGGAICVEVMGGRPTLNHKETRGAWGGVWKCIKLKHPALR